MSTKIIRIAFLVASAAVLCGATRIALADSLTFYSVKVLSTQQANSPSAIAEQKSRLTKLVERLRQELMVGNLGEANIGCDRCGELVAGEKVEGLTPPNQPLNSLKFALIRNDSQLAAFVRSYHFVQAGELGSTAFKIEIDGMSPPAAACSAAQIALGCKSRQYCFQTGGCDKPGGSSCDLCPVQ